MADVFISYARSLQHDDHRRAADLKRKLERDHGLSVFLDVEGLEGGDEFPEVLNRELRGAGAVVALWSQHAMTRPWLRAECAVAQNLQTLIPIAVERLDAYSLPIQFINTQYIDFAEGTEPQWRSLLRSLARTLRKPELIPADPPANLDARPVIGESTTAESTNVRVVLDDMAKGLVRVPDYQRDSDQWDDQTKSMFIESIINNFAIPAFFFEQVAKDDQRFDEVIDGQQRLTTLHAYNVGRFKLLGSADCPYISSKSENYAGKYYDELPQRLRQAFDSYRLSIIKLRDLGDLRLEVFRRINQGGTPLSAQDIRLAYYGAGSATVTFTRLAGIYDKARVSSQRFIDGAKEAFGLEHPWDDELAFNSWSDWWQEKDLAKGQTPSEMFLWSLVSAEVNRLDAIVGDTHSIQTLGTRFTDRVDDALDVYCAQLQFDDRGSSEVRKLIALEEMKDRYFPHFQRFVARLLSGNRKISLAKYRLVGTIIGAMYRQGVGVNDINNNGWSMLTEFLLKPRDCAPLLRVEWPESKGRWLGPRGYAQQMEAATKIVRAIAE